MIFDRTSLNKLFRYCMALCDQRDDAYDLLQDSVERYLTQTNQAPKNSQAFIRRIARNRFYDQQRRKKIVQFDVLDEMDIDASHEQDLESILIDELTLKYIWKTLSTAEKEVVFLWAVDGLSASQIADELDIPRATVLSRLRRMRIKVEQHTNHISGDQHNA